VLPREEAQAQADAAIQRQERGRANEAKVASGTKLGQLSGATKLVEEALRKG